MIMPNTYICEALRNNIIIKAWTDIPEIRGNLNMI